MKPATLRRLKRAHNQAILKAHRAAQRLETARRDYERAHDARARAEDALVTRYTPHPTPGE